MGPRTSFLVKADDALSYVWTTFGVSTHPLVDTPGFLTLWTFLPSRLSETCALASENHQFTEQIRWACCVPGSAAGSEPWSVPREQDRQASDKEKQDSPSCRVSFGDRVRKTKKARPQDGQRVVWGKILWRAGPHEEGRLAPQDPDPLLPPEGWKWLHEGPRVQGLGLAGGSVLSPVQWLPQ